MAETTGYQSRCYAAKVPKAGPPLIQDGKLHLQTHHIGWIVTGIFMLISCLASFWLINQHLQWYTNKKEQRYIVRILFMVPIYAVISFASYLFWNHSTPLVLLRDCYEALVLTAFFYLLLTYISPDLEGQKEVFLKFGLSRDNDRKRVRRGDDHQKWVFPLGFIQSKPADGLYFLQMMKWGVLQYCVIRPTTTLAAVVLDYVGLYCEESWSPGWGHIYLTVIMSVSVTVAMYCLIQLYVTISEPLKPQRPLLKLFAVKAVVFLTFWQATFLSVLTMFGVIKDTEYMTAANINIGIGAIAECVEMTIFAFLYIKCFSYKVYLPDSATQYGGISAERTSRLRSLGHVMNFKEMLRELWSGSVYMVRRMRGKETDKLMNRAVVMEGAFGRPRIVIRDHKKLPEKPDYTAVNIEVEETVHVGAERQWLGLGENHGYGPGYVTREKSDGLEEQIEKELTKRGYGAPAKEAIDRDPEQGHSRGNRSWWRNIYDRLSQSGPDDQPSPTPRPKSIFRPRSTDVASKVLMERVYDDPPPISSLRTYRTQQHVKPALPTPDVNFGAESATAALAVRSDSLLARVFPYGTSSGHSNSTSAEALTTSAQSHHTRVHLHATPEIVVNASTVPKISEVITPNVEISKKARVTEAAWNPELPRLPEDVREDFRHKIVSIPLHSPQFLRSMSNRSSHSPSTARANSIPGPSSPPPRRHTENPRGPSQHSSPHAGRFRPTRDQLRMPAPLAPVKESSNQPPIHTNPASPSQSPNSYARNTHRKPSPSFPVCPPDSEASPASSDPCIVTPSSVLSSLHSYPH